MTETQMNQRGAFKFGVGQTIVHRELGYNSIVKARVYDVDKQKWCYVIDCRCVDANDIHNTHEPADES